MRKASAASKKASRTRVKGKPKPKSLSQLKKALEALQKQIVILTYGRDCYTCPQKDLEGMNCQLGHVPWPRSDIGPKVKFDPAFTRIQCFRCNINLGGNGAVAYARMLKEGIDLPLMRLTSEEEKGKMVPRQWYIDQIALYQEKLAALTNK